MYVCMYVWYACIMHVCMMYICMYVLWLVSFYVCMYCDMYLCERSLWIMCSPCYILFFVFLFLFFCCFFLSAILENSVIHLFFTQCDKVLRYLCRHYSRDGCSTTLLQHLVAEVQCWRMVNLAIAVTGQVKLNLNKWLFKLKGV